MYEVQKLADDLLSGRSSDDKARAAKGGAQSKQRAEASRDNSEVRAAKGGMTRDLVIERVQKVLKAAGAELCAVYALQVAVRCLPRLIYTCLRSGPAEFRVTELIMKLMQKVVCVCVCLRART